MVTKLRLKNTSQRKKVCAFWYISRPLWALYETISTSAEIAFQHSVTISHLPVLIAQVSVTILFLTRCFVWWDKDAIADNDAHSAPVHIDAHLPVDTLTLLDGCPIRASSSPVDEWTEFFIMQSESHPVADQIQRSVHTTSIVAVRIEPSLSAERASSSGIAA
jgi:hypothetical protein